MDMDKNVPRLTDVDPEVMEKYNADRKARRNTIAGLVFLLGLAAIICTTIVLVTMVNAGVFDG